MYTTTQAAAMIGCGQSTASRWAIRLGLGEVVGGHRLLSPAEVQTLREHISPGRPGNPEFGAALGRKGGIASGVAKRKKSGQKS